MNIAMLGTGYVGLVTGACFAETGNDVICVDIDEKKINGLKEGRIPFYEPGLEEVVYRNSKEGRLTFSTDLNAAVRESTIIFIAVGTPESADGQADTSQVFAAAEQIAQAINGPKIVVTKSTVPVGTTEELQALIGSKVSFPVSVVSNPEFLKEGAAVEDFMGPDRVVIGGDDRASLEAIQMLYEPFVRTGNPVLLVDSRSAEMSKYASNALLATKISFMNEIAALCDKKHADVEQVRRVMGLDRRIGPHFIFPGLGYGGSCFPKDIRAMIAMGERDLSMSLLRAVDQVNERQKEMLLVKVKERFGRDLSGLRFAVWGLSFKPRTDDMREAPSIRVIDGLLKAGAEVHVFDPEANGQARKIYEERISYGEQNYDVLKGADALLILTEWAEFRRPNFERLKQLMRQPVVFDGRNLYDPMAMRELGFAYVSIGRNHE